MLSRKHKRRIRILAAEQWTRDFEKEELSNDNRKNFLHRQARKRLAGTIADEFPSESFLGSLLAGLAIRFAFKLLEEWITNKIWTSNDINAYRKKVKYR